MGDAENKKKRGGQIKRGKPARRLANINKIYKKPKTKYKI
jgi:hypothetical protein